MSDHPSKTLRLALGLTQEAFGRSVEISGAYQAQVETRRERYGAQTALRIADRYRAKIVSLGITVEDLIRGSRDHEPSPTEATEGAA